MFCKSSVNYCGDPLSVAPVVRNIGFNCIVCAVTLPSWFWVPNTATRSPFFSSAALTCVALLISVVCVSKTSLLLPSCILTGIEPVSLAIISPATDRNPCLLMSPAVNCPLPPGPFAPNCLLNAGCLPCWYFIPAKKAPTPIKPPIITYTIKFLFSFFHPFLLLVLDFILNIYQKIQLIYPWRKKKNWIRYGHNPGTCIAQLFFRQKSFAL